MNEARGIWFSHYYDENNQEHSFTLRQDDEDDGAFVDRVVEFQQTLTSKGFFPKTRPAASPNVAQTSTPPAKQEFENNFEAGALVKTINEGSVYWKVSGLEGKFPRYPVAIWPEVIERDLCPMDELTADSYPLEGYVAYYEKNEKGNPRKVIQLVKGA